MNDTVPAVPEPVFVDHNDNCQGPGGTRTYPTWLMVCDISFAVFFTIVFFLRLIAARERIKFLRSPQTIVDYITVIPAYFAWALNFSGAGFLRVLAIIRVARLLQTVKLIKSVFIQGLFRLLLTVLMLVFIFSCLLLLVEPTTFGNWHTAAYFVVVSATTVGFGDLTTKTDLGRSIVVLLITACVIVIPLQGFWLSAASAKEKQRQRAIFTFNPSALTVLLFLPRGFKRSIFRLRTFVQEFFRRVRFLLLVASRDLLSLLPFLFSQYGQNSDHKVNLVMMSSDIDPDESQLLADLFEIPIAWQKRVTFVTGEGTFRADLRRVHAEDAAACVVFNHAPEADRDNALLSLSVSAVNSKIPILVPLWSSDNEPFARASGPSTFVFSTKEFRSHLLANALYAPGLPTLLLNLFRTKLRSTRSAKKHIMEYQSGRRIGIQVSPITDLRPTGERLMRLAQRLYTAYAGSILIGVVQADGVVFVPNRKHVVEGNVLGIFLREETSASFGKRDKDDSDDDDDEDVASRRRRQLAATGGIRSSMDLKNEPISRPSLSGLGRRPSGQPGELRRRFSFDFGDSAPLAIAVGSIPDRLPSIERVAEEPSLLESYCYVKGSSVPSPLKKRRKRRTEEEGAEHDGTPLVVTEIIDTIHHVLVVAFGDDCDNLADLVAPLRSRALAFIYPVVILAERQPSPNNLQLLARFSKLFVPSRAFVSCLRLIALQKSYRWIWPQKT